MTDRDRLGLRGSAKTCELHRTWYSRGCGPDACETTERNDVTVLEFRRDGLLQRRWYKNPSPDSSEWTHLYEYNDANQPCVIRTEQGGIARKEVLEYDLAGRISRKAVVDNDSAPRIAETYSYDSVGRKTKITHIDPNLPSGDCGMMFGVDGTDAAYSAPGAARIMSVYDEVDFPIEHVFHDGSGKVLTRIDFRRDERGNLVEEVCTQEELPPEMMANLGPEQLEAVRMLFTFRRRHRYDEQNRKIETSTDMAPQDFDREIFAYNDHGDVTLKISESSHSEYDFGEAGQLTAKPESTRLNLSETQFRYQYDSHGNWIEKIVENPGGPVWSIERRTIAYFD